MTELTDGNGNRFRIPDSVSHDELDGAIETLDGLIDHADPNEDPLAAVLDPIRGILVRLRLGA